jgi:hypothetical protein
MNCPSCSYSFEATNQHSTCPKCGKSVGTEAGRDDVKDLAMVTQWFTDWDDATYDARQASLRDYEYYDGRQWTDEQIRKLRERNQPALVFNRIGKKIDYLLGAEIRNRTVPKALPRSPGNQDTEDESAAATDALRFVSDSERLPRLMTKGYKDFVIPGVAGFTVETEVVDVTRPGSALEAAARREQDIAIRVRRFNWDRLWWDLTSRETDFTDALYLGTIDWMDYKEAVAHYRRRREANPDRVVSNFEEVLSGAKEIKGRTSGNETHADRPRFYDPKRDRVQILVAFYKEGGEWFTCHFVNGGFLERPARTGHLDENGNDMCPLIMGSAYCDQDGNRYGPVRRMIGAQDEINQRRSKLVHRNNTRQTWLEKGTVDKADLAEWKKQIQKPDGTPIFTPGALQNNKVRIEEGVEAKATEMTLLQEAKEQIDGVGPNTPTAADAATSGRDRQLQQQLGSLEMEPINDTFREMKRAVNRHVWLKVKQVWTYEKWMRVSDDAAEAGYRFVGLNRATTKGKRIHEMLDEGVPFESALRSVGIDPQQIAPALQQAQQAAGGNPQAFQGIAEQMIFALPVMAEPHRVNDVSKLDVDIIIDEAPDTSSIQHEIMADLMKIGEVMAANGGQFPIDLWVEASELRPSVKSKLLERLRPKNPDPEQQKTQQMLQAIQQQLAQLSVAKAQADVQKTQADAQLSQARAADLGRPDPQQAPQMPEPPSPVDAARAERERVGTQLDVARARSHMQRDAAQTQKLHVDAMATAKKMMEPPKQPGPAR